MPAVVRIVPVKAAAYCMPWHARGFETEDVHGARCCYCDQSIAAPESARGKNVSCIYCGMDRNEIPAVEIEP